MSSRRAASFVSLLDYEENSSTSRAELLGLRRRFIFPLVIVSSLLVVWAVSAPLSGAIVASGQLKAELNRKTVQHQEGGIVRKILVRDGDQVRAGQPLVLIGDVRNDSELSLLQDQLNAERLRSERATAEAALKTSFEPPERLVPTLSAKEHLSQERALFAARRRTLEQEVTALEGQIRDSQEQAVALRAQITATEESAKLSKEELTINEKLVREGYVQRARVLQLERVVADYNSRLAEQRSQVAFARQRGGDLQARIAQLRNEYQQQAADEAKAAAAKIRELEERLRPSRDQVERQYVRAPVDGQIMALRVSTVDEVIAPRQPILDILPSREKLVVEARIRPQDINNVHTEQKAEVRLSSLDARTTPLLEGKVTFVSPDRMSSPDGSESWFVANVEVDAAALRNHPQIRLQAGMPAELFVTTPERTLFQYFAKPLNAFVSRAMREP